ncbi:hypothetical protein JCM19294_1283 [Nonlabens tegetincola]|uniref:Uncharacterized protein n=1 Tax=Nonlabens tegetincola TaxID=323273 RepID=A0A090Q4V4_9FLAO|nr:hypothetical protein JCM19294_1283 [Nonlabens tegetincola]
MHRVYDCKNKKPVCKTDGLINIVDLHQYIICTPVASKLNDDDVGFVFSLRCKHSIGFAFAKAKF